MNSNKLLGPSEKEVYELIKRAGEIMTVQIPARKAGAIPSLIDKGLIEVFKKRTSPRKEKKTKYVKLCEREVIENKNERSQIQVESSKEESIELVSKIAPIVEDLSILEGVGSKYQELLRASGYSEICSIAESLPIKLHAKLIEFNARALYK
jgi:hypothetical protein